jgi:hypothetical protein
MFLVYVQVMVDLIAQKLSKIEKWRQDQSCFFQQIITKAKVTTTKIVSWVQVLIKIISAVVITVDSAL